MAVNTSSRRPDDELDRVIGPAMTRQQVEPGEDCVDAEQLAAYADDGLSAEARGDVETHLAACAWCRRALALQMEVAEPVLVANASGASAVSAAGPVLTGDAEGRRAGAAPAKRVPSRTGVVLAARMWLPLAATLIVGAGLWFAFGPARGGAPSIAPAAEAPPSIQARQEAPGTPVDALGDARRARDGSAAGAGVGAESARAKAGVAESDRLRRDADATPAAKAAPNAADLKEKQQPAPVASAQTYAGAAGGQQNVPQAPAFVDRAAPRQEQAGERQAAAEAPQGRAGGATGGLNQANQANRASGPRVNQNQASGPLSANVAQGASAANRANTANEETASGRGTSSTDNARPVSTVATAAPAPPPPPAPAVPKMDANAKATDEARGETMLPKKVEVEAEPVIVAVPSASNTFRVRASRLWRIRRPSTIEHSADGGSTWTAEYSDPAVRLTQGAATSDDGCWIVGGNGLVLRVQPGRGWTRVTSPTPRALVRVAARDRENATVTDEDGRTYDTTDGGRTWRATNR